MIYVFHAMECLPGLCHLYKLRQKLREIWYHALVALVSPPLSFRRQAIWSRSIQHVVPRPKCGDAVNHPELCRSFNPGPFLCIHALLKNVESPIEIIQCRNLATNTEKEVHKLLSLQFTKYVCWMSLLNGYQLNVFLKCVFLSAR